MVIAHGATSTSVFSGSTSKGSNLGGVLFLVDVFMSTYWTTALTPNCLLPKVKPFQLYGTVSESEEVKRMMYRLIQHEIRVCQWSALRSGRDVGQIYVSSLISCAVKQGKQLPLQTSFHNWRWQRKRVLSTQLLWSATKALVENATYYRASGPFWPFSSRLYLNSLQD